MTVENIDLKTIGFFSLVVQAYVFKFLWVPADGPLRAAFLGLVVAVGYSPPNCCCGDLRR